MSATVDRRYRRSPFLVMLWSANEAVLLQCDTLRRFRIHPNLIVFLSELGEWSSTKDLIAAGKPIRSDELAELHSLGILQAEDDVAAAASEHFLWDPLELAIQRRTAHGGYWPEQVTASPPRPFPRLLHDRPAIELPQPAPGVAQTLSDVLRSRRSVRTYAARSLELGELSTLLFHSARIVQVVPHPQLGDQVLRPFPTAGARSELEIYVVSVDVSGLEPGAHYYEPRNHRLFRIRERDDDHARILRSVHAATGGQLNRNPAVILVITAVFERMMWKYRDLGLTLIYKDVGCLFQTFYLVATALGLAPCAIGACEEVENSRWLGLDPLCESQVGCFLIGPRNERKI